MYGFQLVDLILRSSSDFKIIPVSKLNDFKVILSGRGNKESFVRIMLETESDTLEEIHEKLRQKIDNLKLYVNLYSDNIIDVKVAYSPEIVVDKKYFDEKLLDSLDSMKNDVNLTKYLDKKITQQQELLQLALNELQKGDVFNAFPKLINWLDDNEGKGTSRFCPIRDACDHGVLDASRALKQINEKFPQEFEIEDNVLKRNSSKNIERIKYYLPEVLEHVKKVFREKYVN